MIHFHRTLPRFWRVFAQFFTLFSLCAALIVGCNPQTNQTTPSSTVTPSSTPSDRIIYGTTVRPRTLDPADSYEMAGIDMIYNLGDTLYTYTPGTTDLVPHLATAMPAISEDGLTYIIPLREGVEFHDGTPFNAEAMKFSIDRFMNNGGKPAFLLNDIVLEAQATGEYELTITLQQPFAGFTALLAFAGICPVSPAAYEIGDGSFNPNQFVGTGPYTLTEFNSDTLHLEANPNYWGDKPKNKGVDVQIYTDNAANLFNSFTTGAVDLAYQALDPEQITNLISGAEKGDWQMLEAPGTAVNYMVLNQNQAPLDQLPVRQAIAHLVDRALITERVFQGQAEPVYSLIPTALSDYYEPALQNNYGEPDGAKAKEILNEAGFSATNPAVIPIWFPSASTPRSLVAQTLQALAEQELEGALTFEPNTVDGASFFKNIREGVYPAALVNWYPDFLDPDNYLHPFLSCSQGSEVGGCSQGAAQNQGSFYYSEAMNELIEAQRKETNPEARQGIIREIQQKLADDLPYIPLWQTKEYLFARNEVKGLAMNPSQTIPFWLLGK
ncbi:ABC transporter substrate-binding protein [Spirulina sp. CCNP1310]|uniref:ABC transporter substrate-binding protein n=1 Tax=Spirulina sp. CCNP1310 TaxID=3110249 RepID=UPI002B1EB9C1|nr:ABC transporter substrate-binding protein [Spirulina sp. CCNP1310]MEA5419923.1 ABC transporter substrate-binding protein [Spirulina sp. CCNP1310]